jgi:glycylpeptide N-tetradecanoyltransferase
MACITGIPTTVSLDGEIAKCAAIDFLCIHKKLRNKRIAPVLITEIIRRGNLKGIWHGIFTSQNVFPTPFSQARNIHRPLNTKKLIEIEYLPPSKIRTTAITIKMYQLPD